MICAHDRKPTDCMDCAVDELARAQRRLDVMRLTALQLRSDAPELIFNPVVPLPALEPTYVGPGGQASFRFCPQRTMSGPFLVMIEPYDQVVVTALTLANNHLALSPGAMPAACLIARPWEERPELRFFRLHSESSLRVGCVATLQIENLGPARNIHAMIYGRYPDPDVRRGRGAEVE